MVANQSIQSFQLATAIQEANQHELTLRRGHDIRQWAHNRGCYTGLEGGGPDCHTKISQPPFTSNYKLIQCKSNFSRKSDSKKPKDFATVNRIKSAFLSSAVLSNVLSGRAPLPLKESSQFPWKQFY